MYQDILADISSYGLHLTTAMLSDLDVKEAALVAYEEAILLAPHESAFYYHKGQLLEQLGRLAEAQRAYAEAQRLGYHA